MGAGPVGRGGDEGEALEPEAVRAADEFARPARARLGLAALAVARRAVFAVGAGGRCAAGRAASGVAALTGLGFGAGGVVQVVAHGGGGAVEQVGDLGGRPALLPVV